MSKERTLAEVVKVLDTEGTLDVLIRGGFISDTPVRYFRIFEYYKYQLKNLALYEERERKGHAVRRCCKEFKASKMTIYNALNMFK